MAQKFNLTEITSKSSASDIKPRISFDTPREQSGLYIWLSKYTTRVYLGYYLSFALSVVISAYIIETTGIATKIMDNVRATRRSLQTQTNQYAMDVSSMSITLGGDAVALITNPANQKSGESSANIRYYEIPDAAITRTPTSSSSARYWGIYIPKPISGEYIIDVYNPNTSNLSIDILSYTRMGDQSVDLQTIIGADDQKIRRLFVYVNKDRPDQIRITKQEVISAN